MAFPARSPADDLAALEGLLAGLPGAVVAFSGGVDSSVVAAVAGRVLGERALAVTAVSPALATGEIEAASAVAAAIGVAHRVVTSTELEREGYRRNGRDRCYHCKTDLYDRLTTHRRRPGRALRRERRRPGRLAAGADARRPSTASATRWSRPGWARRASGRWPRSWVSPAPPSRRRPASRRGSRTARRSPRRSSRRSTGPRPRSTRRGYAVLRVRHHGDLGRVQIAGDELGRVDEPGERAAVEAAVRAAGYREVEIDPHPFRSGSLNLEITPA